MIYSVSLLAICIFTGFVLLVLGLSFFLARKPASAASFFAAGGQIHWAVNGIAFAGDYLSAASFLGICGMIAFSGYDGFLYSIGYLAGWVVALFVVAEPMKRLGKFTFTDALDSKFNSKSIQLMAAISTLVVSVCYLIPQMVGAGALVKPLLGLPRIWGVIMVGTIVIFIVATAGMKSTTYVQFIKGGLLIVFSSILVISVCNKGLSLKPQESYHNFITLDAKVINGKIVGVQNPEYSLISHHSKDNFNAVKLIKDNVATWWKVKDFQFEEMLSIVKTKDGGKLYNGEPKANKKFFQVGHLSKIIKDGKEVSKTGKINPIQLLSIIDDSEVVRFTEKSFTDGDNKVTVWYQDPTSGKDIMKPGLKFKVDKGSDFWSKLNFVSLMLALFFGTAALPHILIRYYTVPSPRDARKSTIVAIGAIGFFYILTLFMGLGAMVSGVIDVESSNMAAPLLAKSFGIILFSCISAIAFATVLGTVSGLIVAASGAVAHDLLDKFFDLKMSDREKVRAGKFTAVIVGIIAIILGILFKGMNVSYLVGWAFAVAASANLPAILMLLFWKKTTSQGIASSIFVGMVTSLGIILLSPSMYVRYGLDPSTAIMPLENPGIISIPLSFLTLIVVSLCTQKAKQV
ncbi:MAG: cation acetate symporter [Candidatus Omnitrophica bacterium]|nr:cation acetate symporter [Candidatus Omnitrophota bacterium]MBU4333267.1 cation acetate symporter [Candidatus Omnitrophota bacterium]